MARYGAVNEERAATPTSKKNLVIVQYRCGDKKEGRRVDAATRTVKDGYAAARVRALLNVPRTIRM